MAASGHRLRGGSGSGTQPSLSVDKEASKGMKSHRKSMEISEKTWKKHEKNEKTREIDVPSRVFT